MPKSLKWSCIILFNLLFVAVLRDQFEEKLRYYRLEIKHGNHPEHKILPTVIHTGTVINIINGILQQWAVLSNPNPLVSFHHCCGGILILHFLLQLGMTGEPIYLYIYLCNIMQLEYEGPNLFFATKTPASAGRRVSEQGLGTLTWQDLEHHWPTPTMGAFDQLIVWKYMEIQ